MNTQSIDALVAVLARIDEQKATLNTFLIRPLTSAERIRVTDELAYLKRERHSAAAKLAKIH